MDIILCDDKKFKLELWTWKEKKKKMSKTKLWWKYMMRPLSKKFQKDLANSDKFF